MTNYKLNTNSGLQMKYTDFAQGVGGSEAEVETKNLTLILLAFITENGSLEPWFQGLFVIDIRGTHLFLHPTLSPSWTRLKILLLNTGLECWSKLNNFDDSAHVQGANLTRSEL